MTRCMQHSEHDGQKDKEIIRRESYSVDMFAVLEAVP